MSPELVDANGAAEFVEHARRGLFCWRGLRIASREPSGWHGVLETHALRRPRSMELSLSEACDEWFERRFGWRARSNHCLFVSGSREQAEQFGTPVVVIPIAPARYLWSPRITDLTQHFKTLGVTSAEVVPRLLEEGNYRGGALEAAITSGNEIMVRCERYFWSTAMIDVASS